MVKRDDRKLVDAVAKLLNVSYFSVFGLCLAFIRKDLDKDTLSKEVQRELDHFADYFSVPDDIENWLLDVVTCRIPIRNDSGRILNPRKPKCLPKFGG